MFRTRKLLFIIFFCIYLLVTALFYIVQNTRYFSDPVRPFTTGVPAAEKVWELTTFDGRQGNVNITRLFHNKVFYLLDTYVANIYRLVDPVFLFTFSERIGLYDFTKARQMLYPIELPVAVFSVIVLLRTKHNYQKIAKWVVISIGILIGVLALLLFPLHPLLLFPYVFLTRVIIGLGILSILQKKK